LELLEFKGIKDVDTDRVSRILQTTGRKGHPVAHFAWGSRETIVGPDGKDETLQACLRAFKEKYYGAEGMTLAIQVRYIEREAYNHDSLSIF
jgi:secreted Zn-dependent insulinase-like peptidase